MFSFENSDSRKARRENNYTQHLSPLYTCALIFPIGIEWFANPTRRYFSQQKVTTALHCYTFNKNKGIILRKCRFDTLVDLHPKYWSHANTDLKKIEKLPHCSSALLWTSLLHHSSISYQTFQNSKIYLNSTPDDSVASVNVFRRFRTDNIRRSVW